MERPEYARMAALEDTMWWYRALHRDLIAALCSAGLPLGSRVLDAGCGTGGFLARLTTARPDLELEGLELDEEASAMARKKTGLPVRRGSIDRMPYLSGAFSAIVSADVLSHRGVDERAALAECYRCLGKEGVLLLNLPAHEWLRSAHDERIHGARRYSAKVAGEVVRAAGFSRATVEFRNSLSFPLMLLHRLLRSRGDAESDVRPFPAWQDRLLFGVTDAERGLRARGIPLPFGGSIRVEARK